MTTRATTRRCAAALALLAIVLALPAIATATEVPFLAARVNDTAGILSAETVSRLEALLKAHEDSTSNQVAVLTIASLEGEPIESYSIRVVDAWKLGQQGKDNGVLLLIAKDDRKLRIEVGRGLEGDLPDITCGSIIRNEITPRFKEGDYDAGVSAGVEAILSAIKGSYVANTEVADDGEGWAKGVAFLIFIIVVGPFTAIALFSKGGASWFLYCFLLPFWLAFPLATLGGAGGLSLFAMYALGFLAVKLWFSKSQTGRGFYKRVAGTSFLASAASGGWSSSGGGSSSSSSFSGGGGGFSGGGASGSW